MPSGASTPLPLDIAGAPSTQRSPRASRVLRSAERRALRRGADRLLGPTLGLRAWMAAWLVQYRTNSLVLADREAFAREGWATELGSFAWGLAPVGGGQAVGDRGHDMQAWKRAPDGRWRFAREIWNSAASSSP